jgi:hypothetical protein
MEQRKVSESRGRWNSEGENEVKEKEKAAKRGKEAKRENSRKKKDITWEESKKDKRDNRKNENTKRKKYGGNKRN